jgi:hypothetical protein
VTEDLPTKRIARAVAVLGLVLLVLCATAAAKPALRGGYGVRAGQARVLRGEVVTGTTKLWVAGVRGARSASVTIRRVGAKKIAAKKRLARRHGALVAWKLDSTKLRDGRYVVRARVTRRHRKAVRLTTTFRISNHGKRTDQLIASALAKHKISFGTSLEYRFYAFLGDPRLPTKLRGAPPQDDTVAMDARAALTGHKVRGATAKKLKTFLLRPTDPRSAFYTGKRKGNASAAACGPKQWGPEVGTGDGRAWAWQDKHETAFPGAYRSVQKIASTALSREEKDMGPAADDTPFDCAAANPNRSVDVYLVNGPAATARRSSESTGTDAYAITVPQNCANGTCSSFVLVNLQATGLRRSFVDTIVTHEIYHVLEMARMPDWLPDWPWLTEAGATWAQGHYEPHNPDAAAYSNAFYAAYQNDDPAYGGLGSPCSAVKGVCHYAQWIYPFFMNQEGASIAGAWKAVDTAPDFRTVNERLNAYFSYATHLRDFAVRDFNVPYHEQGGAAGRRFQSGSGGWPAVGEYGTQRVFAATGLLNTNGAPRAISSGKPRGLDFLYQEFTLPDKNHLRRVKFDFSPLGDDTDVDVLVHVVGQKELEHRRVPKDFEFCRDEKGDDIDRVVAIYTNHAISYARARKETLHYRGWTSCQPITEWRGPFKAVEKSDNDTWTLTGNGDFTLDPSQSETHDWFYPLAKGTAMHLTYSGHSADCTYQGSGTVTAASNSYIQVIDPHESTAYYGLDVDSDDSIPVTYTCPGEVPETYTQQISGGEELYGGTHHFDQKMTELKGSDVDGSGSASATSTWDFDGVKTGDAP